MESFVDLAYRGLSLGRRVKLTQVRPSTGYLETPAPMPVGTMIAISTDDGHNLEAIVTAIHEQVGGSDKHPGMTVKPKLEGAIAAWWKERVALPEEEPPPPARSKPLTVRPRTNTVVEDAPAGASAPAAIKPTTTAPMPTAAPAVDPAMAAALAAASQTVARASAPVEEPGGRTTVMPAVDPETLEKLSRTSSEDIPVTRISALMASARPARASDEMTAITPTPIAVHEVIDDGKQTTMMDAVDLSALGLDAQSTTGPMAAVKPDDENGNGDDDEPPARPSQPNLPSSVKKRKKRNR